LSYEFKDEDDTPKGKKKEYSTIIALQPTKFYDPNDRDRSYTDSNTKYKKWFLKENHNLLGKPNGKPPLKLNITNTKPDDFDIFGEDNIQLEKYDSSALSFVLFYLI
jgi:hypothetical protein